MGFCTSVINSSGLHSIISKLYRKHACCSWTSIKLNFDFIHLQLKKASEMKQNPDNFRDYPTSAEKANCIIYVLRATSNLSIDMSKSLKIMHEIRQCRTREGNVFWRFSSYYSLLLFLTHICTYTSPLFLYI